jgi:zinc transport system substrate-binding protein
MMTGHHHGGEPSEGSPDPHIWLSPELVKIQAKTIERTLINLLPEHTKQFEANLVKFDHALDSVNAEIDSILAPYRGRSIYAFHPAYGYFVEAYGLKQVPIEIEGKEPSAKELSEVIGEMQESSNHVIFVQPQFSSKTAQTIADAIHGKVVPLDPLAEDYPVNLVKMARTVAEALSQQGGSNE